MAYKQTAIGYQPLFCARATIDTHASTVLLYATLVYMDLKYEIGDRMITIVQSHLVQVPTYCVKSYWENISLLFHHGNYRHRYTSIYVSIVESGHTAGRMMKWIKICVGSRLMNGRRCRRTVLQGGSYYQRPRHALGLCASLVS